VSIDANPFWEPLTGGLGAQDVVVIREHMDALKAENHRLGEESGSISQRLAERLTRAAEELRLPRGMAGLSVAETNGWLFDPSKSLRNIDRLAATYPAVFQVGGYKEIDNQLWGFIDGDRRGLWLGRLNYIEGRSPCLVA
jgi:hypothetical protein